MKTRITTGIISIAIMCAVLTFFQTIYFNVVCFGIVCIALYEVVNAMRVEKPALVLVGLLPVTFYFMVLFPVGFQFLILPILTFEVIYFAGLLVFFFPTLSFQKLGSAISFSMVVLFGFFCIVYLKVIFPFVTNEYDNIFYLLLILAIAWGGDVFAYFVGVTFGKRKLAPVLSPNKSIEGAVGGFFGSVLLGLFVLYLYTVVAPILPGASDITVPIQSYIITGVLAGLGAFIGVIGDLFASAIKRQNSIKDYGNIFPGHGGILDRFDSVLLVAPVGVMVISFTPLIIR